MWQTLLEVLGHYILTFKCMPRRNIVLAVLSCCKTWLPLLSRLKEQTWAVQPNINTEKSSASSGSFLRRWPLPRCNVASGCIGDDSSWRSAVTLFPSGLSSCHTGDVSVLRNMIQHVQLRITEEKSLMYCSGLIYDIIAHSEQSPCETTDTVGCCQAFSEVVAAVLSSIS